MRNTTTEQHTQCYIEIFLIILVFMVVRGVLVSYSIHLYILSVDNLRFLTLKSDLIQFPHASLLKSEDLVSEHLSSS
jgi:hypothetical protein